MSYDYRVVSSNKVTQKQLNKFIILLGNYKFDVYNNQIVFKRLSGDEYLFSFSCDCNCINDLEDIDDFFTEIVLSPKWSYELSVPYNSDKLDINNAKRFSEFIATNCNGAVYDPQLDKVIFPKSKIRRYTSSLDDNRINVINLYWFIPGKSLSNNTIKDFLNIVKKYLPEAIPKRYGDYEPLQHKFDGFDNFIDYVIKSSGDMVFFKSTSPCYGGYISTSSGKLKYDTAKLISKFSLTFDARAFEKNENWNDTLINLFINLSIKLKAFYSMGFVEENIIAKRNSIGYDGFSKRYSLPPLNWWVGIPNSPMWLNWFGKPYAKEIEINLSKFTIIEFDSGIFYKTADFPIILKKIKKYPKIPLKLLALNGNPAELIPDLDI